MHLQAEQQIYARVIETMLHLENTDTFTKMDMESTLFKKRFLAVDKPEQYYVLVALLDLFEFMFQLQQTKVIDEVLW